MSYAANIHQGYWRRVFIDISNFVVPLSASAIFHDYQHEMANIIMNYNHRE